MPLYQQKDQKIPMSATFGRNGGHLYDQKKPFPGLYGPVQYQGWIVKHRLIFQRFTGREEGLWGN